ncbi:ferredoxin [Mycolicibacterium setense]|uniref:ferredoxin n=1 Tax=Mycolicibacterium setense TaxID=431269 RepID=UPI0007EC1562|nr:ferredoxin [Mycolicibacterium setense]OBB17675.1 ferredoxin [Mycolicibacterium setense]
MAVKIDSNRCQGHALCAMAAPDIFDIADDGVAEVLVQPTDDQSREAAEAAALSCPEQAISVDG